MMMEPRADGKVGWRRARCAGDGVLEMMIGLGDQHQSTLPQRFASPFISPAHHLVIPRPTRDCLRHTSIGRGTMTQQWLEHTVAEEEAGRTVQEVLTGPMQVSRRMIQKLTRARGILLNRRAAYLGRKVKAGDVVAARVQFDEEAGLAPVAMPLSVVH